jgi:hypothetical protein
MTQASTPPSPSQPGSAPTSTTRPTDPETQLQELLEAERQAHRDQPRNFKEDALTDKVVRVEPDGTGPTPTETFDPQADQKAGSGSGPAAPA